MFIFTKFAFDRKESNKIAEILAFTAYFLLNSMTFLMWQNWLFTLISNIVPFFGITFLYKSSIWKKIVSTFGVSIFTIVCDILILTIQNFMNINSVFFDLGFVTNIFLIASMNFALRLKKKDKEKLSELSPMYYISIIFVPMGSIVLGYFTAKSLDIISLISSIIILLINADVFYLYDTLTEMFYRKRENELVQVQNKAYQNQIHIMQESQLKIRCLKHDMDNHIFKMQYLLENQKYLELAQYLNDAKQSIKDDSTIVNSGNETINSILNYKLAQIKSMDIQTEYDVLVSENLNVSTFDINIVLGNLIDNAIEALRFCSDVDDKRLVIKISNKQGYIKIYIANTFDGIILSKTRKGDTINHGLGLKSVSKTVEKYGGLFQTNTNGNLFEASVIMYEK